MNTKKHSFYKVLILILVLMTAVSRIQSQSAGQKEPELKNPFPFESVELPVETWGDQCSTYYPFFLEEDVLKEIIRVTMEVEGLKLTAHQIWKGQCGELYLDGLDTVSGIGYVVIDYSKMGWGTLEQFGYIRYFDRKQSLKEQMDTYSSDENSYLQLFKYWKENSRPDYFQKQRKNHYMEVINNLKSGQKPSRTVMENLFLENYFLYPNSSWLSPVKQLVDQIVNQLPGVERTRLLEAFFEFDQQGAIFHKVDSLDFCDAGSRVNAYLFELIRTAPYSESSPNKIRKSKKLLENIVGVDLYASNQNLRQEFINCIRGWKTEIPTDSLFYYSELTDRGLISLDEIYEMTKQPGKNGQYIMVINPESDNQALISRELDQNYLSQISENDPERNKKVWEACNRQAEQQFENKVRTYIRWARQQSGK